MATSSFSANFNARGKRQIKRIDEALKKESQFSRVRPISDEELAKGRSVGKEWISRHSER